MIKCTVISPSEIGKFNIDLENHKIEYAVKRSYRARCVRLEIHRQNGLTVFIPSSYNISDLTEVLIRKGNWILEKLAELSRLNQNRLNKDGRTGDSIPYLGKRLKLTKIHSADSEIYTNLEGNGLHLCYDMDNISTGQVLELWYRQKANELIKNRTNELCNIIGVKYNRITIRKARTRWGSCSQRGNLNFNWKLIMAPAEVIDYVIIHELAHLKEMNHSKRFWDVVNTNCPEWRRLKKWLEDHEAELNAIKL